MSLALPPTQYLVIETLAARWRLGEVCWTFPNMVRPALRGLQEAGLIAYKDASIEGCQLAWFTEKGKEAALDDSYIPPIIKKVTRKIDKVMLYEGALYEIQ